MLRDTRRKGGLWATLRFQRAATAVARAGHIQKCLPIVDQPARRREVLPAGQVYRLRSLSNLKIVPIEGPVLALRLVDHRDVRSNLLVFDEPVEHYRHSGARTAKMDLQQAAA